MTVCDPPPKHLLALAEQSSAPEGAPTPKSWHGHLRCQSPPFGGDCVTRVRVPSASKFAFCEGGGSPSDIN